MKEFIKFLDDKIKTDNIEHRRNAEIKKKLYKLDPMLKKRRQMAGLDKKR